MKKQFSARRCQSCAPTKKEKQVGFTQTYPLCVFSVPCGHSFSKHKDDPAAELWGSKEKAGAPPSGYRKLVLPARSCVWEMRAASHPGGFLSCEVSFQDLKNRLQGARTIRESKIIAGEKPSPQVALLIFTFEGEGG